MDHQHYIVRAKGLQIFRDKQAILADIDLQIQQGEFCYLLGGTGSGKSTLLKTLYGGVEVHAGQLIVAGADLTHIHTRQLPNFRRKLGMIFQDFRLLPSKTVYENLDIILRATEWTNKKQRKRRIEEILSWVNLSPMIDRYPHQLSGGEQQRVAIGRALLNDPQLIIGDEPTGNLDPHTSDEIMYLLKRLHSELNTAVLLATHDYRLLDKFSGRVLRIEKGQLLEHDLNEKS